MGQLDKALSEYDRTIGLFPNNRVALTGRAEVLKAMGQFGKALEEYDAVVEHFSCDVVAQTGRAELLKAMGQFDKALVEYDRAVGRFPANVVARNGRAGVLKAMGQFDKSLAEYNSTIERFPNDVVTRTARAETLKVMGNFEGALRAYEETAMQFPHDGYVLRGRASVLLLLDRVADARALLLPDVTPVSQNDWIRYHMLAMTYLRSSELNEAVRRLSHGAEHAPWQDTRRYFINSLAVAWIRREDYGRAIQVLEPDLSRLDILERQKRLALIGHSRAAGGERQGATETLNSLGELMDPNLVSLRTSLFERFSLGEERNRKGPVLNLAALDFQIEHREFLVAMA